MEPRKVKYWTSVAKNAAIFLLSLLLIFILLKLSIFYIPFLIGFIISLIIEPIIKKVTKKTGLARKTSAIIVLILLFTILISLIILGVVTLVSESSDLLSNINVYIEKIYNFVQKYITILQENEINLPNKFIEIIQNGAMQALGTVTTYLTTFLKNALQTVTKIPIAFIYITITILSTYFICADKFFILDQFEHHVPRAWAKKFGKHVREISATLGGYLKAEAIIIVISFFITLFGLIIGKIAGLNIAYPLLSALGIAFVDALPILGAGTVMIPWAIISAINGDIAMALTLISLYIVIVIMRQLIEPKLVSKGIGIHPIFTLIAMYTGFRITGVIGLFLGPIILIILKNIFAKMIDDGIVKTIFNRK